MDNIYQEKKLTKKINNILKSTRTIINESLKKDSDNMDTDSKIKLCKTIGSPRLEYYGDSLMMRTEGIESCLNILDILEQDILEQD